MAYTSTIRTWWAPRFKQGSDQTVTFLGRPGVKADMFTLGAWRALETALQANGYGTAGIVSTYYPRLIAGSTKWSLHSYSGVAMDIDPYSLGNPYIKGTSWDFSKCKFTRSQVDAVLRIRTTNGFRVWRWGGDFGDYMHWQLDCRISDIETGIDWSTVPDGDFQGEDSDVGLKTGDEGAAVEQLQEALLRYDGTLLPKWGADADFGDETATALRIFQADNDLIETAVLDVGTSFCITPFQVSTGAGGSVEDAVVEVDADLTALEITVTNLVSKLRSV